MSPTQRHPAVVIGAGIIGIAAALRLQCSGRDCVLIDPGLGDRNSASFGNAGHLAIEQVAPLASWASISSIPRRLFLFGGALDVREPATVLPWALRYLQASTRTRFARGVAAMRGLLVEALPAWTRLLGSIDAQSALMTQGHVVLWASDIAAARGRTYWRSTELGSAAWHDLDAQALADYRRRLVTPVADGIRFTGTGQLSDVGGVIDRMLTAYVRAGGVLLRAGVAGLRIDRRRAAVLLEGGRMVHGDTVLVAAGIGSGELLSTLGHDVPLIAERGYHLHWRDHDWPATWTPTVFEDRSVILTRFEDGLRLAGFVEFARTSTPPDPRKWATLHAHAQALGLPVHGEARAWHGARPTLPDYLPAIGRIRTADNLYYAFGHQHLGVTLAAVTAEIIEALVSGADDPRSIAPFDIDRFDPKRAVRVA